MWKAVTNTLNRVQTGIPIYDDKNRPRTVVSIMDAGWKKHRVFQSYRYELSTTISFAELFHSFHELYYTVKLASIALERPV